MSCTNLSNGETIDSCPIILLSREDTSALMQTSLKFYQYPYDFDEEGNPDYQSGRVALALGLASLLNCSANPNAYWHIDPKAHLLYIEAARDIPSDTEITISYGFTAEQMATMGWVD